MAKATNGKTGEKLAVIDETRADRQTLEVYELTTRKLRVGRVPLLFRALAGEKALLACWQALRPAIRLRAFEEAADDLRIRAAEGAVSLGSPLIETQLEWAGYDVDEIDEIRGQVNVFHYQNAKLLLAGTLLREAIGGSVGGASGPGTARALQRVPRGVPHEMDPVELVPEDANGPLSKVFRQIRGHCGLSMVPDDYRALGRWPRYLELAWSDVRSRDAHKAARPALDDLAASARQAAAELPVRVEVPLAELQAAGVDLERVRLLLERFCKALPGQALDLAQLKVQLDGAEDARQSPFPVRWKYLASDDYLGREVDAAVRLRAGDPKDLDELEQLIRR